MEKCWYCELYNFKDLAKSRSEYAYMKIKCGRDGVAIEVFAIPKRFKVTHLNDAILMTCNKLVLEEFPRSCKCGSRISPLPPLPFNDNNNEDI